MAITASTGGAFRSVSPFTVIWYCAPDREIIISRVMAVHANEAILKAAQQHAEGDWDPSEIRVLCVMYGHHKAEMIEVDGTFSFFGENDVVEEPQGEPPRQVS